ncbi:MAG: cytochrome-c peroxidase, partial [Flavobacteriales bacterium]|nr:cytochrome-c peroxidase [Flavobacteriales bacterium]
GMILQRFKNLFFNRVFEPLQNHSEMDLNWTEAEKRIASSSFYQKKIKDNLKIENIDSSLISKLIAQFLRTLVSQDSKYDRVLRGEDFLTKQEKLGFELMNDQTKGKCLHCHTTDMDPLGTITGFKNNGLDTATSTTSFIDPGKGDITKKIEDYGKFKIPSVRNLGFSSPYMHDGRFKTLEEVLDFYDNPKFSITVDSKIEQHIGGASLNTIEKQAIISFLQTLNDSVFISNKNYSNPFEN